MFRIMIIVALFILVPTKASSRQLSNKEALCRLNAYKLSLEAEKAWRAARTFQHEADAEEQKASTAINKRQYQIMRVHRLQALARRMSAKRARWSAWKLSQKAFNAAKACWKLPKRRR